MKLRALATAGIAVGLILGPVGRVQADAGDVIAGAIIGGILGNAIAKDQARRKTKAAPRSNVSSAQRAKNKEVQVALNYFGYNVGTPDGAIGPKSRAAISQYQALLGYPATGQLTETEQTLLLAAYARGMAGGAVVMQTIGSHPMGVRGLLLMQRDEMTGAAAPGLMAVAPAPAPLMPSAPILAAPALPGLAASEPVNVAATPALPSFMPSGATQISLGSHCNKISLMTNTNGGYITVANLSDPAFALGEQFCLARTYAMAKGEELQAKIAGFTPAQIAEQCAGFGPYLAPLVAGTATKGRDATLAEVKSFNASSGMLPDQLAGTARICLGVGYTTDEMDVAVGSALILTALGEEAYGELVAHHLAQGFGMAANVDRALEWYDPAIAAMESGGAVFAPGLAERPALIRTAAYAAAGRSALDAKKPALPQFAGKLAPTPVPEAPAALHPSPAALSTIPTAPRISGNSLANGG